MKKMEGKYIYRYICSAFLVLIATAMFIWLWIGFVTVNNQTGHLTGRGNIGMAALLYVALFFIIGRWLYAFRIGIDRKAAVLASMALTIITVDVIEIFLSMAITGQFRFFSEFLWRYFLLCIGQIIVFLH